MKTHVLRLAALAATVAGLSACSQVPILPDTVAKAQLAAATGVPQPNAAKPVQGALQFTQAGNAVSVSGTITGLKPNAAHAFHVHEKGDCSAPDLSSAGSHFNPTGEQHGAHDAAHHHAGDLPQLMADASGAAQVSFTSTSLTLTGPNSIIGRAVIVHRDPDDVNAQPVGNAGPRLACGVITRGN
jgi:Cu-Zn family superoxide dismutase